MEESLSIDGRSVRITNPQRLIWPDDEITKKDLIAYFLTVAPRLLPHLEERPLVLTRYPGGVDSEGFYQKNRPDYAPAWIETVSIRSGSGREISYILCNDAAALCWLANQAAVELHPWFSRRDALERPTYAAFDLDPAPPAGFAEAVTVARLIRSILECFELKPVVKTTGGSGIHLFLPLEPIYSYDTVREFVFTLGRYLGRRHPELVTQERRVENRSGRVYVDHLQIGRGKTLVAPYVPRPRKRAPVSMPVAWSELAAAAPDRWTLKNAAERAMTESDPFDALLHQRFRLPEPLVGEVGVRD